MARFIVQANTNVVLDTFTGLMWKRRADGVMPWDAAIDYCNILEHGGYDDWRLPNVRELQSLIDYGQHSPALPSGHPFVGVQSGFYWSSTKVSGSEDVAWHVFMRHGSAFYGTMRIRYCVWPVRGGSSSGESSSKPGSQ
jgi:hypothetical protein